ncbi:LOW QUALITY PROTEIN: tripartite motif-containing protein 14 [Leptosomus discolor]
MPGALFGRSARTAGAAPAPSARPGQPRGRRSCPAPLATSWGASRAAAGDGPGASPARPVAPAEPHGPCRGGDFTYETSYSGAGGRDWARHLSDKVTEPQLLLWGEDDSLAKSFTDEKTQQALKAHDQQLEFCRGKLAALETFSCDRAVPALWYMGAGREESIHVTVSTNWRILLSARQYTGIEKEIQEPRCLLEQRHPMPLLFEHNHYKHFVAVLQSILQKPLKDGLKEVYQCSSISRPPKLSLFISAQAFSVNTTAKKETKVLKVMSPVDWLLFLKHARSPTWEYASLHPRLKLSGDHLVVKCNRRILYPCGPQRSNKLWQVLSRDAFLSGSHCWEADLLHAGAEWWIGAAYLLVWNRASWCLKKFDFEYWSFQKGKRIPILIEDYPDRTGTFLDYEAGILSFSNVNDSMAYLHTFCCNFTEPVYLAFRLWERSIGICKLT